MANKALFSSQGSLLPRTDAENEAGGPAYQLEPKHALAQLTATGCFRDTYYAVSEAQLDELLALIAQIDDNVFLAKLAVYARQQAFMKDMPSALLAVLSKRDPQLMHQVFDRVVDNGRMLRTLLQMIRSGQFGRKSLSYSLQRAFQRWLNEASVGKLLSASIGDRPSLRDVLRLARPTPKDNQRRALFGWLTNKEVEKWAPATEADLPEQVQRLIAYRKAESAEPQALIVDNLSIRWDLLADAARGPLVWKAIARQMGPQALRMNLNTLLRRGAFHFENGATDYAMVDYVAGRIADPADVLRSRQFPYQFFAAQLNADETMPQKIRAALNQAAEIACGNVPELPGPVLIGLDTSGSMHAPVTGSCRLGFTTAMRFVDVAALFAAAILRRNPDSVVVPFDSEAYEAKVDPQDTVLSLSERLAQYGGGNTDCSLPLVAANTRYRSRRFAGVVLVSDSQSWVYAGQPFHGGEYGATGVMTQWKTFVENQKRLSPVRPRPSQGEAEWGPKLVCVNLQACTTTQASERDDILNVGGFSDAMFSVVASFLGGGTGRFLAEIDAVEL